MKRILISDIDKNMGRFLRTEMENEGYSVDLVSQGEAMLLYCAAYSVCDMLILNMPVPSLDYFNQLRLIKWNNPAKKIIIFTNGPASESRPSLLDAGADECFAWQEIGSLMEYLRRLRS